MFARRTQPARETERILERLHRARLDPETRDHRAELEGRLLERHRALYRGEPGKTRRGGRGLRFVAAAVALTIVALAAGAIPVDQEVPLGRVVVFEVADGELPPVPELIEAASRLSGAASVSVDVGAQDGRQTLTLLILGSGDRNDRLADELQELFTTLRSSSVTSRPLVGVFPRSLGELLGRKLLSIELDAEELAASRQEVLRVLGGSASATLDVDTDEGTGRRSIRVRIEPDE